MSGYEAVNWQDTIKKEARGTDDYDLGEVQEVGTAWVHTQRGTATKMQFYIPKNMVRGYDGSKVIFNLTASQTGQFARDIAPTEEEVRQYSRYQTAETPADIEQRIPRLPAPVDAPTGAPTTQDEEMVIRKERVTEVKTIQVPVTREEIRVERRPAGSAVQTEEEEAANSQHEARAEEARATAEEEDRTTTTT